MKRFIIGIIIIASLSLVVLVFNSLIYLSLHHKIFRDVFVVICFLLSFFCLCRAFERENTYKDIEHWYFGAIGMVFLMFMVCQIGPELSGKFYIEKQEDSVAIKHRIFPFCSDEIIKCKNAIEIKENILGEKHAYKFFLIDGYDDKKYVYEARPQSLELYILVDKADAVEILKNHELRITKGDSIFIVDYSL